MIEWICQEEGSRSLEGRQNYNTWQQGFLALCKTVQQNRVFVESVYHSVQRDQIETYLYQIAYDLLLNVVCELSQGYVISSEDQQYIANFYKYGFIGVLLEWVKNGMKPTPEELTAQLSRMMYKQILDAIRNMSVDAVLSEEHY